MLNLVSQYEDFCEIHKDEESFDEELIGNEIFGQYLLLQNDLLNFDLSGIPFEEWQDFVILTDKNFPADFSNTRANIDFSIVQYVGNANFKGCNVLNLSEIENLLNPNDFDEKTVQANPALFLTDAFTREFKEKFYSSSLNISDIATLSIGQLEELKKKKLKNRLIKDRSVIQNLGLDKAITLYNHSPQDYDAISQIWKKHYNLTLDSNSISKFNKLLEQIKVVEVTDIKQLFFDFLKQEIVNSKNHLRKEGFPELFIKENKDIFLIDATIPDEVKTRYFNRALKVQDLLDYPEVFQNISVDYFMKNDIYVADFIRDKYGMGKFQELVKKHPDVFAYVEQKGDFYGLNEFLIEGKDLDNAFAKSVKNYFANSVGIHQIIDVTDSETIYSAPEWLSSMKFQFVDRLKTTQDLLEYTESVFVIDKNQRLVLDNCGMDNIIEFEKETGFFSHKESDRSIDLEMFSICGYYLERIGLTSLLNSGIDFKNGTLAYEEFLTQFANCLDNMRKNRVFTDFPDYDWLQGDFRNKHPEIFLDIDAPKDLKEAFYKSRINPRLLYDHKEYISYLINKNIAQCLDVDIKLNIASLVDERGYIIPSSISFVDEYVLRYGNESLLNLISKYGIALSNITISSFHNEIEDKELIEQSLRKAIYNKVIEGKMDYYYLTKIDEFVSEYPDIFVNFDSLVNVSQDERERLCAAFYSRTLTFDDIRKFPELVDLLKEKNLLVAFGNKDSKYVNGRIILHTGNERENTYSDLELLKVLGNEKFLELCSIYGRYIDGIAVNLNKYVAIKNGKYFDINGNSTEEVSFEKIKELIEDIIVRESALGNFNYQPEDAPDFLKERCPELFLSEDAPDELKRYFYGNPSNNLLTFEVLHRHKEWMPFLKNKFVSASLLRNKSLKQDMIRFLEIFGEEKAIKLGISRAETVTEMMKAHQVDLMKSWYDRTGGKFIPDFVVMQNFNIEEADKFLLSGSNWSILMKIKNFAQNPESREAMLKLAYSFGAFNQDQRGFKKLLDLLTGLPKQVESDKGYIFEQLDKQINLYSQRKIYFKVETRIYRDADGNIHKTVLDFPESRIEEAYQQTINYIKNNSFFDLIDTETLLNLLESLKKEKVNIDFSKDIFSQLYRKNDDGSYTLTIKQGYPKTTQAISDILERFSEMPVLTPNKAHQLFGGFNLNYDAEYREFLLKNLEGILTNPEHNRHVASIQRQFSEIKAVNSNRVLTWELAVSYVQTNKFLNVNIGNERVAEISAIAGYSQEDFNILQQIYNYGKQRTYSSIPRIQQNVIKKSRNYTYETLRLDDPLAMAIGTLTDCCQELNNCAEVCMEHSMVDTNGRVFIIRDKMGNIVAQSWVWRNKDVLCFDNIEIPDKAFTRATKEGQELDRKKFTDEVFEIYKQAAHEFILEDEKIYRQLLESGKITQEQYDGLRLGKVTVGLGYNDIRASLVQNSVVDKGPISRPLPFEEPVKLSRGLYISDSSTQYVLEERENRKECDDETLSVHSDYFIEYSDSNFKEKSLLYLGKLEILTKGTRGYLKTSISNDENSDHIITEIARNYDLNPKTTRIVMNSNFAIIYDVNGGKVKIGDLLFSTHVDNEKQQINIENQVVMQIRLALEQIAGEKEVDVSDLEEKQLEIYTKAIGLIDEMDVERGIGNAR